LVQIFSRLFPVSRGLTHSYWAGNVWALYNAADIVLGKIFGYSSGSGLTSGLLPRNRDQITFSVLPEVTPFSCFILTLLSIAPMLLTVWKEPRGKEIQGFYICSLSSFIFGYHVHEKAILISLIPLTVLGIGLVSQV